MKNDKRSLFAKGLDLAVAVLKPRVESTEPRESSRHHCHNQKRRKSK